jgi:hypothetical protein
VTHFQTFAGIDERGTPPDRGEWSPHGVHFLVFTQSPFSSEAAAAIPMKMTELGFNSAVRVYDLWQQKDLGGVTAEFDPVIRAHGAGLYRVSPIN